MNSKIFSIWLFSMCFASPSGNLNNGQVQMMILKRMPRYVATAVSHSGLVSRGRMTLTVRLTVTSVAE